MYASFSNGSAGETFSLTELNDKDISHCTYDEMLCWTGSAFDQFAYSDTLHGLFTGILFGFLAFFCLFVFTRVDGELFNPIKPSNWFSLNPKKLFRNTVYILAGLVISICIFTIGLNHRYGEEISPDWLIYWRMNNVTYWLELIAMFAFGTAWLVKSKFRHFDRFGINIHNQGSDRRDNVTKSNWWNGLDVRRVCKSWRNSSKRSLGFPKLWL